jgi:hypothetical protein
MSRNGTVSSIENNTGNIPIMDFKNLKDLLEKQYPGYRTKSNYLDMLGSSLSLSGADTLNNLARKISSEFKGGNYPPISTPPDTYIYKSEVNKPQNIS